MPHDVRPSEDAIPLGANRFDRLQATDYPSTAFSKAVAFATLPVAFRRLRAILIASTHWAAEDGAPLLLLPFVENCFKTGLCGNDAWSAFWIAHSSGTVKHKYERRPLKPISFQSNALLQMRMPVIFDGDAIDL